MKPILLFPAITAALSVRFPASRLSTPVCGSTNRPLALRQEDQKLMNKPIAQPFPASKLGNISVNVYMHVIIETAKQKPQNSSLEKQVHPPISHLHQPINPPTPDDRPPINLRPPRHNPPPHQHLLHHQPHLGHRPFHDHPPNNGLRPSRGHIHRPQPLHLLSPHLQLRPLQPHPRRLHVPLHSGPHAADPNPRRRLRDSLAEPPRRQHHGALPAEI